MNVQEEIKKRRTFAIISHPDAGKTTITEQLLYFGGEIREATTFPVYLALMAIFTGVFILTTILQKYEFD